MTDILHLPDVFNLIAYDKIDSTNEEAKRLAQKGAVHGTVVWAKTQQAGRGRRGRPWVSETGNLFCSFIIKSGIAKPGRSLAEISQLSFATAVGVADALSQVSTSQISTGAAEAPEIQRPIQCQIQCKWPNDILIDGRKTAGILLETVIGSQSKLEGVIAGVGVNVEHFPNGTEFPATSLQAEGVVGVPLSSVLEAICLHFSKWLAVWENEGFQAIRLAWLEKAFGLGKPISVRLPSETCSGVFEGLDPHGALILNDNGTRRHIAAGDVYFDQAGLQRAV